MHFLYLLRKGFILELNGEKVELIVKVDLKNPTFGIIFMSIFGHFDIYARRRNYSNF